MSRTESKDKLCPTLDTRCDCLGITVKAKEIKVADDIKPSVRENYVRDKEKIAKSDKDIFRCNYEKI